VTVDQMKCLHVSEAVRLGATSKHARRGVLLILALVIEVIGEGIVAVQEERGDVGDDRCVIQQWGCEMVKHLQ
jgi:hypothetical protein